MLGQDLAEDQGPNPFDTIIPVSGPSMDSIRSVTGSIILAAIESGPGPGPNQALGFGNGIGPGIDLGYGLNEVFKDNDLSVQALGTCTESTTHLSLSGFSVPLRMLT